MLGAPRAARRARRRSCSARAREQGLLSARGEHRVLRVARTIADLDGSERVRARDVGAALALRAARGPSAERPRLTRARDTRRDGGGGVRGVPAAELAARRSWARRWTTARRDRGRLLELLALDDDELIEALAGRRRDELRARLRALRARDAAATARRAAELCRHDAGYPHALRGRAAPHMLSVGGGAERFARAGGARRRWRSSAAGAQATTGSEMARSLARGLAASGVDGGGRLAAGIALAAHAGRRRGPAGRASRCSAVVSAVPARRAGGALLGADLRAGCAVSELPGRAATRAAGARLASERTVAALAGVRSWSRPSSTSADLAARGSHGRSLDRSRRSRDASPRRCRGGAHALLRDGAQLVRGPRTCSSCSHAHDPRWGPSTLPARRPRATARCARELRGDCSSGWARRGHTRRADARRRGRQRRCCSRSASSS